MPASLVDPMADSAPPHDIRSLITQFRTSEHWAVSLARDLLWVIAVVGSIALALFLICGTWPAVVTIESGSMIPHMNIGDLVIVVGKDRFGDLRTWDDGKISGYKKFEDYGDVIIYRPNGYTDMWAQAGLLPLSGQRPIIHRTMTWTDAGRPVPQYINVYQGAVTPAVYIPVTVAGTTATGYRILTTGNATQAVNYTPGKNDIRITSAAIGNYLIPGSDADGNTGYIKDQGTIATHGGYITKGDNNPTSDQVSLSGPVKKEWIIGKAFFVIPLVGYLPLYIGPVIVIVIILMVLHEIWLRRKEGNEKTKTKPVRKGKNQR
jgi:signal peptidase